MTLFLFLACCAHNDIAPAESPEGFCTTEILSKMASTLRTYKSSYDWPQCSFLYTIFEDDQEVDTNHVRIYSDRNYRLCMRNFSIRRCVDVDRKYDLSRLLK